MKPQDFIIVNPTKQSLAALHPHGFAISPMADITHAKPADLNLYLEGRRQILDRKPPFFAQLSIISCKVSWHGKVQPALRLYGHLYHRFQKSDQQPVLSEHLFKVLHALPNRTSIRALDMQLSLKDKQARIISCQLVANPCVIAYANPVVAVEEQLRRVKLLYKGVETILGHYLPVGTLLCHGEHSV